VTDYTIDSAQGLAADCADCGGTGTVPLLVSAGPCKTCGGSGKGHWVTEYSYDRDDELVDVRTTYVPEVRR
jgi:DnaJ-class molecular chaperone